MVKNSIKKSGGDISIKSEVGKGTEFTLRFPVVKFETIIRTIVVSIGDQKYNIPEGNVKRILRLDKKLCHDFIHDINGTHFINLSGKLIPVLCLAEELCKEPGKKIQKHHKEIVLIEAESDLFGLDVSGINESEEVVMKPLEKGIDMDIFMGISFHGSSRKSDLILNPNGIARSRNVKSLVSATLENKLKINDAADYVLFSLSSPGLYALSFNDIYRIEEFLLKDITTAGKEIKVIYRDQIIPIIFMDSKLGLTHSPKLNPKLEKCPTLIIRHFDDFYGIAVNAIESICKIKGSIQRTSQTKREFKGNLNMDNLVVTVIDPLKILNISKPKRKTTDLGKQYELAVDLSIGWGIF